MGRGRQFKAVIGIAACGPPPGVLQVNLECGHHLLFNVPARVPVDLAGWVADLLIGTVRACGPCRFDEGAGAVPQHVSETDVTRPDPLGDGGLTPQPE